MTAKSNKRAVPAKSDSKVVLSKEQQTMCNSIARIGTTMVRQSTMLGGVIKSSLHQMRETLGRVNVTPDMAAYASAQICANFPTWSDSTRTARKSNFKVLLTQLGQIDAAIGAWTRTAGRGPDEYGLHDVFALAARLKAGKSPKAAAEDYAKGIGGDRNRGPAKGKEALKRLAQAAAMIAAVVGHAALKRGVAQAYAANGVELKSAVIAKLMGAQPAKRKAAKKKAAK